MAKQDILGTISYGESAGEATTTQHDSGSGEQTGSDSEAGEASETSSASPGAMRKVIQNDTESENESSSSEGEEEEEKQMETSGEPSRRLGNTRVFGTDEVENTKRKREEEGEDGSEPMDDESSESDARAGLSDEAEPPSAGPSLKKRRKSVIKEEDARALTPPPTPRKSKAKKDVKGSKGKNGVGLVEDTGTDDGEAGGAHQLKPNRRGRRKEADRIVVKASSPPPLAKPRGRPRKTTKKGPKAPGNRSMALQGQSESAEGNITAGEIGVIFEALTAGADWAAIVAKTNSLVGLKRLGGNVSRHWKTVARKRLLDAYGA